jgi:hypothetical protein
VYPVERRGPHKLRGDGAVLSPTRVSRESQAALGSVAAFLATVAVAVMAAACAPAASNGTANAKAPAGGQLQPASTASAPMTTFTDPTENAFTASAPQGWTVKGGIKRSSPSIAKPWITAVSPDGATTINLGDPSLPMYTLPSAGHPPGATVQDLGVASPVEPSETSVQFAADYAKRAFAQTCAPLAATGSQAEPALAHQAYTQAAQIAAALGVPAAPASDFEGGSASFTCQANGAAEAAAVLDVIDLFKAPVGGFWSVSTIAWYRTPAISRAQTDQIARAMLQGFQSKPQWRAQMAAAAKKLFAPKPQPMDIEPPGSLKTCIKEDENFHCTAWAY